MVGFVLLWISLKRLSVRVVLDLLHELTNTRVLSLFHSRMWQSKYSEINVHSPRSALIVRYLARDLRHGRQWVAPFYHDLFRLQRWSLCFHERNVFGRLLARDWCHGKQRVSPFYHDLGLDLVGLIGNFWIVAQLLHPVVEQLLNRILSSNHVSRKSLEEAKVTHILSRIWLLQFPSEQLLETISWECFVKNDSVRSCSISSLQSKIDVDPIHRILMFLPCSMHVLCKTRCIQIVSESLWFVHGSHRQKESCLSVAQILTSRYQSRIDDGMKIERTSNMVNMLEENVRNNDIVL